MDYTKNGKIYTANDGYVFITSDQRKVKKILLGKYSNIDNYTIMRDLPFWEYDVNYKKDDECIYNYKIYKCLLDHTSDEVITPDNENYWIEQ